ncbi:Hypothetical predicted protein [Mytilus galloprovincialis]|uniref:Mab-21-like HhH/H2TH-like domain-containing protein n=1 Tax=Mytilus galloprovincialis TaxID=29158 RepID=A0A8B6HTX7_MYTGA|nr:Hypothetical predicted protein [Mytilus galloprovincialis]
MNLKDKNLSLQFYDYLCDIIGSEEVVRTRREIFSAKDIVESSAIATSISSGSKAEGIDLNGSDYDQMVLLNIFSVYESSHAVKTDPSKLILLMNTSDIKPGFTKIKLVNKFYLAHDFIFDICKTVGEETYISSKKFRELHLPGDMVIHGPCQSTASGVYDYVVCLRCNEWITPAEQWIYRSRTTWPHHTLVTAAVQYGVLFVPIGCKDSPNEDVQWRISFSVTEKLLIHSFSHTQLLCYAIMKIILKDIIKPRHGDLICSYFLKTIMFWLSEEINPSKWKPENMIPCFFDCISRLIYCVEYKTCLHYFIPENNLFEDRFTDKEHDSLLNTLRFIYESPLISLFETSTCQNFILESVNSHGMELSASELSCYHYLSSVIGTFISDSQHSSIKRLANVWINRELCSYILSEYAKEVLQSSHFRNMMVKNKSFYQLYKRTLCICSDSISSWLLVATFFYQCKRFPECLVIINYTLSKCTPDKIYPKLTNSLFEQTVFKDMKHRCGLLLAIKHLIIDDASFRHPFSLLPDELMPLIVELNLLFPPVVYLCLLQFLCCHHLGDKRGKQNSLHGLELTIREQYFILHNDETLITIYAILDIVKALL